MPGDRPAGLPTLAASAASCGAGSGRTTRRRLGLLLALTLQTHVLGESRSSDADPVCLPNSQCGKEAVAAGVAKPYYWAMQKGDAERHGASPYLLPRNFSSGPTWAWKDPHNDVIRNTPLIDGELNIYLSSAAGRIYKFSPQGEILWSVNAGGGIPAVGALYDGKFFSNLKSGHVFALDMQTGKELWRVEPQHETGSDTASLLALDGLLVCATGVDRTSAIGGNWLVVARSVIDGSVRWTYGTEQPVYNFQAASARDGTIVFQDKFGGVYRLQLETGELLWRGGITKAKASTTAAAVIHEGLVFAASNYPLAFVRVPGGPEEVAATAPGAVYVYNLTTGALVWNAAAPAEANQAVAVGPQGQGRPAFAVVGYGSNPGICPALLWYNEGYRGTILFVVNWLTLLFPRFWNMVGAPYSMTSYDALSGRELWSVGLGVHHLTATAGECERLMQRGEDLGSGKNPHNEALCLPDACSQPVIGGDGTAYQVWQDGKLYAIRDDNGDGVIDKEWEVSSFDMGDGAQGSLGVAPGMLAVAPCGGGLFVFRS